MIFLVLDTKNEGLFFVMVGIISRHHKKILGVTINHFSNSVTNIPECELDGGVEECNTLIFEKNRIL
jgi:hypothetical protein